MINKIKNIFSDKENKFSLNLKKLELLSPLKILNRGYSACFDKENKIVKSVKQVSVNDMLDIKLSDGTLKTKVEQIL